MTSREAVMRAGAASSNQGRDEPNTPKDKPKCKQEHTKGTRK